MNILRIKNLATASLLLIALVLMTGCASTGSPDNDPFEKYNRGMTRFNLVSDRVVLAPVARGYKKVVPSPIRNGISNFLSNLREPYNALNDLLQGNLRGAGRDTGRFLINTTLGFAGLNDVASYLDLPEKKEDFGQTLAVWGVPPGPHLVLPFLGPNNIRDGVGLVPGFVYNSAVGFEDSHTNDSLTAVGVVDTRSQFLGLEDVLELQPDKYLFLREGYRQRRAAEIANGTVENSEGSDEALLEELLEDN